MGLKKSDIARLALKQFLDENAGEEEEIPFDKIKHLLDTGPWVALIDKSETMQWKCKGPDQDIR